MQSRSLCYESTRGLGAGSSIAKTSLVVSLSNHEQRLTLRQAQDERVTERRKQF
jgi:hypothetical protein